MSEQTQTTTEISDVINPLETIQEESIAYLTDIRTHIQEMQSTNIETMFYALDSIRTKAKEYIQNATTTILEIIENQSNYGTPEEANELRESIYENVKFTLEQGIELVVKSIKTKQAQKQTPDQFCSTYEKGLEQALSILENPSKAQSNYQPPIEQSTNPDSIRSLINKLEQIPYFKEGMEEIRQKYNESKK